MDPGGEEAIDRVADEARDPEERAAAAELSAQVQRALGGVAPVFREAVILRDLQGLTYEEIASVLGVRLGTVRSRIARGREQLRRLMQPEREGES